MFLPDQSGLAERVRQILASQRLSVEAASLRLRCEPTAIQALLNGDPTLGLIVAIVREFAVDPSWLLTGNYNYGTHNAAVEDPARVVQEIVKRLESPRSSTSSEFNTPF